MQVRAMGVSITSALQWAWNVVIARSTPYMILNIGYGTYVFFGCMCILSFIWVYFFLPGACDSESNLLPPAESQLMQNSI